MKQQAKPTSRLPRDVRWGLGWTIWVAAFFSAYVLLATLAGRISTVAQDHVPTLRVLAGYWVAALLCGTLAGVLRPLAAGRLGAFSLGVVIGFFAYGTLGVVVYGPVTWVWWGALVASVATGGLGVVARDGNRFAAGVSQRRMVVYFAVLAVALLLLWLDTRFHIVNK